MTTRKGETATTIFEANLAWEAEVPFGWRSTYRDVIKEIFAVDETAKVSQAKEKFGELRIYMREAGQQIYDLIDAATDRARGLCQQCGSPAVLMKTTDGYYATLCESHSDGFGIAEGQPTIRIRLPRREP